jgi:carboxyl-terminal processing protease
VVGERTYGDASVRRPIPTEEGGAIILSVAKYYSPSGKAIQDDHVVPSVQVNEAEPVAEIEEEGPPETPAPPAPPGEDPILKKAIEVVTQGAKG